MASADARAVRALSHPLRLELLDLLRFEGPSTATLLARRLGESSGATSYHLRQLARHGFVEEVTGAGRGRERWWRHRERRVDVAPASPSAVAQRAEAATLIAEILSREAHALHGYLTRRDRLPGWEQAGFLESRGFLLTAQELDALCERIDALLADLRPADATDAPEDALPVRVLAFGYPFLPPEEAP
jgi:DNA-binding transcriptional ArsR family regulator